MNKLYSFIKSPNAPVFALGTMILTFFQMYAKLYYYHNSYATGIQVIDIIISLIAAGGLSTATFIIIIHSRKVWMPIVFASLDFIGGFLFYGKDISRLFLESQYMEIGSAMFIPLFKAFIIYYIGEIFLAEVNEKIQQHTASNTQLREVLDDLRDEKERHRQTQTEKLSVLHQLTESKNQVRQLEIALSSSKSDLSLQLEQLRQEKEQLRRAFEKFKTDAIDFETDSLKYRIQNIKKGRDYSSDPEKLEMIEKYENRLNEIEK